MCLALIDPELIASAMRAARDTVLMLSPLALVVIALLLPYIYRILFLRAKVDKRSYEEGKSKTAPMVRRLRRHLDFAARHWSEYVRGGRRNLKYRIEVSLLYDFAKAVAAYYASDQWRDHLRRQGVANLVFMDEDKALRENLDYNGFFLSPFFKEGVVNRYLMQPNAVGFGSVRVQGNAPLLARATTLFREALDELEPQYEEGHIYLPFLTMSRWERLRFRIHTMIITRLLSEGVEKAVALTLSYGLVALLKGDTASSSAVDFIMDIVALLFMAHVFDSVLKHRCGDFKTRWEDRERYYYRRQMHQFIVGLDSAMARAAKQRDKEATKLLGTRAHNPRSLKRLVRTLAHASRHPQEVSLLLGAAQDVMEHDQSEAPAIVLVLLKELATNYPAAYEKLMQRWRIFRHPWAKLDGLVNVLMSDAPLHTVAAKSGRSLPERGSQVEWHRAVHALQHEFAAEMDEARVAHLLDSLAAPGLTPGTRRALVLSHFCGGLLWRLRQIEAENPLGRQRDARIYHATLTFTLPALERMQARQAAGELDYGLPPAEFANLSRRIQAALPLPAGHQLRAALGNGQGAAPAFAEIQSAVALKRQPTASLRAELPTRHLREWLDTHARTQRGLGVLASAVHEASRNALAAKLNRQARAGTDSLLVESQAFDSGFNPLRAPWLRRQLVRRSLDGQPNEAVLSLLGFWGSEDAPPTALGNFPIRLTFLDLQPVTDYLLDRERDAETLDEITHQALVEFYVAARMAASVHELPDVLTRPAEGDDPGGSIARQMAVIRSLRARIIAEQEPLFLLLQEAAHQLEIIFDPLHASFDHLLGQAAARGPEVAEATRANLHRLQHAGVALLLPLTYMAENQGDFAQSPDAYWQTSEPGLERERFLRQFDVRDRDHAHAILRARVLLQCYNALCSLLPARTAGERLALTSFDTLAGDTDQLRIAAATVMTMIDQSGLRTDARFRAIREVLATAMTRQGYCNRGNLSDLIRVTLRRRERTDPTAQAEADTQRIPRLVPLVPDLMASTVEKKPAPPLRA